MKNLLKDALGLAAWPPRKITTSRFAFTRLHRVASAMFGNNLGYSSIRAERNDDGSYSLHGSTPTSGDDAVTQLDKTYTLEETLKLLYAYEQTATRLDAMLSTNGKPGASNILRVMDKAVENDPELVATVKRQAARLINKHAFPGGLKAAQIAQLRGRKPAP